MEQSGTASRNRGWRGVAGKIATVTLSSLIVGVFAAEAAIRILDRKRDFDRTAYDRLYVAHPFLRLTLAPGVRVAGLWGGRTVTVNRLGFRGAEIEREKPPGTFRIACLGGSTTFGSGESDDAHAWPAVLESDLRARLPGRAIEVVNAGCPTYTTASSLVNYALRVRHLSPDLVIVYHAYNDFKADVEPVETDYANVYPPYPNPIGPVADASDWLADHILLYRMVRKRVHWRWDRQGLGMYVEKRKDAPSEEALRIFRKNIEAIVTLVQADGATVLLNTFPHRFRDDMTEEEAASLRRTLYDQAGYTFQGLLAAFRRYSETIREVATERGTMLADSERWMPKDAESFTDCVHFTDAGSAIMAENLARVILDSGVIAAVGRGPEVGLLLGEETDR